MTVNSFFPPYIDRPQESDTTPPINLTRIVSVSLDDDWFPCNTVTGSRAYSVKETNGSWTTKVNDQEVYLLADPDGIINGSLEAIQDDGIYLSAGTICKVHLPDESQDGHYELLVAGEGCQEGSGSGSEEEGSGAEGSGSGAGPCSPVGDIWARVPGFDATTAQGIMHVDGCWTWISTTDCGSSGGGAGGGISSILAAGNDAGGADLLNVGHLSVAASTLSVGAATFSETALTVGNGSGSLVISAQDPFSGTPSLLGSAAGLIAIYGGVNCADYTSPTAQAQVSFYTAEFASQCGNIQCGTGYGVVGSSSGNDMQLNSASGSFYASDLSGTPGKIFAGKLNLGSLPTSAAGLSPGDIWNNGGVLNVA